MTTLVLALATAILHQQSPWTEPASVTLQGWEQAAGGSQRAFTATRIGQRFAFTGSRSVAGQLAGRSRTELLSEQGILTWLERPAGFILQLPSTTISDAYLATRAPRFTKADLLEKTEQVGRLIGRQIKVEPPEKVAERETITVHLGGTGDLFQKMWFDATTGITMRQQDLQGKSLIYERLVTSIETPVDANLMPPKGVTIRGIPGPDILVNVHSKADAPTDIDKARKAIRLSDKLWIKEVPKIEGFRYIQTHFRDAARQRAITPRSNALGQPEIEPGGLPPGWTARVTLEGQGETALIAFEQPGGGGPMVRISADGKPGGFSMSSEEFELNFLVYRAADGTLVISPAPTFEDAERARRMRLELEAGAGALIQSDLLHERNGDTVTFLQMANMKLEQAMRGVTLPKPTIVQGMTTYEIIQPFPMKLIVWKSGLATYALVGTKHTLAELAELAAKLK